jgi:hypothetical protein
MPSRVRVKARSKQALCKATVRETRAGERRKVLKWCWAEPAAVDRLQATGFE